jgi:regulator of RNase E activity RraA
MIGDILGGHLRSIGCAGLVVDGAVRDIDTLGSWADFPVFARAVNPRGPTGASDGAINGKVTVGGCLVSQGDLIIGDRDGVVALSPDVARSRIGDAKAKLKNEETWTLGLKAGKTAAEVFGLAPYV